MRKTNLSTLSTAPTTATISILITLIVFLASCTPSAIPIAQTPTPTETPTPIIEQEQGSGAVFEIKENSQRCAQVTAYNLNMREAPEGTVTHWLYQNQIVTVIDSSGKWWKISAYNTTGYAHSAYMTIVTCQ